MISVDKDGNTTVRDPVQPARFIGIPADVPALERDRRIREFYSLEEYSPKEGWLATVSRVLWPFGKPPEDVQGGA